MLFRIALLTAALFPAMNTVAEDETIVPPAPLPQAEPGPLADRDAPAQTGTRLAEPEALRSLIQHASNAAPAVRKARAAVQAAQGLRYQSTRSPNPVFGWTASEVGNEGRAGQQGVFWSQNFVVEDKLSFNHQAGGWDVQAATWLWHREQLRVEGDVRIAWYAVAAAEQKIRVLASLQEILAQGAETARLRFDAGESGRGPLLQAKLEQQANELALRNSDAQLEAAKRRLVAIAAADESALPDHFSGLETTLGEFPPTAYAVRLKRDQPELHAARARVTEAQWRLRREQVEPLPDLQTQFAMQYDDSTKHTVGGIQIGVALPLIDRNRGNISAAGAEYVRACQEVQRLELEFARRAAETLRDRIVAKQETRAIDSTLMPLAKENLATGVAAFRAGESSYLDLLTAQRSYVDQLLARIDALRRLRQAESLLESLLTAETGSLE